eukprot:6133615-Pyramimonas_sp.AAC.1
MGKERSAVLRLPCPDFYLADLGPNAARTWHRPNAPKLGSGSRGKFGFDPGRQDRDSRLQL